MALIPRYVAAIVGAALAPAVIFWLPAVARYLHAGETEAISVAFLFTFYVFVIALGHAVFFGLPAVIFFQRRGWTTIKEAAGIGFLVGALPMAVLSVCLWLASLAYAPSPAELRFGLRRMSPLVPGLVAAVSLGVFGWIGGLVGWLVWRASERAPVSWAIAVTAVAAPVVAGGVLTIMQPNASG